MKHLRRLLFVIHFTLVIVVLTHLNELWDKNSYFSQFINAYSSVSYCNRNFGFFAPNVASDYTLQMYAYTDRDSISYTFPIYNREMKNRIYSLMGHFGESGIVSMDLFSRSWGVYCMNQLPNVNKIHIVVYENIIPDIESFNKGKRITKTFFYETTISAK